MKERYAVRFELIVLLGFFLMGQLSILKAEEIFHKTINVNGVSYAAIFSHEQFEQTIEVSGKAIHNVGSVIELSLAKNFEGKSQGDTKPVWSQFVVGSDPTVKKIIGDVVGYPKQQSLVLVYSEYGSNALQIEEVSPDSIPKEIPKLIRGTVIESVKPANIVDHLNSKQLNSLLNSSVLGIDELSILIPKANPEIRIKDLEGRNLILTQGTDGLWKISQSPMNH